MTGAGAALSTVRDVARGPGVCPLPLPSRPRPALWVTQWPGLSSLITQTRPTQFLSGLKELALAARPLVRAAHVI